ncbi:hypothetical protein [Aurantiacibacter sp. MUD61]|uniref:hypothetical protein n=1 Tax=Aurantiacibacter sp. MUD61 TaxID=3009083 RepID=UPI0022F0CF4D|nr:hypothetical protein [Aurantiacibacter sp. MUD61]
MAIDLRGIPFVLISIPLISLVLIVFWSWLCRKVEAARTYAVLSLFGVAPTFAFMTLELRWGEIEIEDSPAAGLPYLAALYEAFWIFCGCLVLILLFQGRAAEFIEKRRLKKELDAKVFE